MRDAELLALVCLEPSRSHLIYFFACKKFWISTNWDVVLLSWHIKQIFTSVIQWCLRITPDITASQQFIFRTLRRFLLLAHTSTQLTLLYTQSSSAPLCFLPPGTAEPSPAVKKLNDIKSLWCSQREIPAPAPCKQAFSSRGMCIILRKKQLRAQKS